MAESLISSRKPARRKPLLIAQTGAHISVLLLAPESCLINTSLHGNGATARRALLRNDGFVRRAPCQVLYHEP